MLLHILTCTTWRNTILHWMKIRFLNQDNLFFLLLNKLFLAEEKCIVDYCRPFQDKDVDSQAIEKNQSIEGKKNSRMVIHGRLLERTIHESSHYDIAVSPSWRTLFPAKELKEKQNWAQRSPIHDATSYTIICNLQPQFNIYKKCHYFPFAKKDDWSV